MLYSNNYFTKELRQKYTETKMGLWYLVIYGIFVGLFSFSLHFLMQTMYESVLTSKIPQFMAQSYHTVLYTYLCVCFIFFLLYFKINYNYITFHEVHCNRWYLLKRLGYKGIWMVLSKLAVILISVMIIYTTGFLTSILLAVFLKYSFIIEYFFTLYLVGCINVLLLAVLITLGSLFITEQEIPKYFISSIGFMVIMLQYSTHYFKIVRNKVLMQNIHNLFSGDLAHYLLVSSICIVLGLLFCISIALHSSSYYHHTGNKYKHNFRFQRIIDLVLYTCITIFLIICAVLQVIILSISFASPQREISIRGTIPYVFQSSTMEETIQKNDLTYFEKLDVQAPLEVGDIVLFKEDSQVYVERIISIHDDYITVDIDNYPKDSKEGIMVKSILRTAIYGRYRASNPYLGALILFANTMFGRLIFLVLPSILLFFNQRITKRIKSVKLPGRTGGIT